MWVTSTANDIGCVHVTEILNFPILNSKNCKQFPKNLINVILCPFLSLFLIYKTLLNCPITIIEILLIEIGFFKSRKVIDI